MGVLNKLSVVGLFADGDNVQQRRLSFFTVTSPRNVSTLTSPSPAATNNKFNNQTSPAAASTSSRSSPSAAGISSPSIQATGTPRFIANNKPQFICCLLEVEKYVQPSGKWRNHHWLATLQAISEPYCQAVSVVVSVCLSTAWLVPYRKCPCLAANLQHGESPTSLSVCPSVRRPSSTGY